MSYKIPSVPSPQAYREEMADFWEVEALRNSAKPISQRHILATIGRGLDEKNHDGIESEDDDLDDELTEVLAELQDRQKFTNGKHPFTINKFSLLLNEGNNLSKNVYLFLLLCTRFNMQANRVQNDIDGALLFEHLCAHIAQNYFGANSQSFVFGTGAQGNFETKIKDLIYRIGEGGSYRNIDRGKNAKNDDGIDVVAFKNFADERDGKLIAFGQCKTGDSTWRNERHKLKPYEFCNNWLSKPLVFPPLPLLFITDTMNVDKNFLRDQQGLLVFNRFRIMEYLSPDLNPDIATGINHWLEGALNSIDAIK